MQMKKEIIQQIFEKTMENFASFHNWIMKTLFEKQIWLEIWRILIEIAKAM